MPPADLLDGIQLIKRAVFDGFYEFVKYVVELVKDHPEPTAFDAQVCRVPELHAFILFEYVFDSKHKCLARQPLPMPFDRLRPSCQPICNCSRTAVKCLRISSRAA
jgi:hypothetical protein